MTVVYIAGSYRAATPWRILANIRKAQDLALDVWKLGAVGLCPHSNTALFDGEAPDAVWLDGDHELLRRSDAVLLVEGWQSSSGAQAEVRLARELTKPVFETLAELRDWLRFA